jgi:hypothetical protein
MKKGDKLKLRKDEWYPRGYKHIGTRGWKLQADRSLMPCDVMFYYHEVATVLDVKSIGERGLDHEVTDLERWYEVQCPGGVVWFHEDQVEPAMRVGDTVAVFSMGRMAGSSHEVTHVTGTHFVAGGMCFSIETGRSETSEYAAFTDDRHARMQRELRFLNAVGEWNTAWRHGRLDHVTDGQLETAIAVLNGMLKEAP